MRHTLFANPATRTPPVLDAPGLGRARPIDLHRSLPGYAPTPLHEAPALAQRLGVGTVLVKDEATRLGLPSFKILGASWATVGEVQRAWLGVDEELLSVEETARRIPEPHSRLLVAATDGNHGRGVARMASMLGVACRILVPAGTAQARIDAIAGEGAEVTVVDGTYDDAIAASAALAGERALVISDTSWEGYTRVPAAVIAGYSTLFDEADAQIADRGLPAPDVLVLQAGVGAFAAAGLGHYRSAGRGHQPRTVVVEPESADCLLVSARAGRIAEAPGPHPSTMAGLNCGLPSVLAWPVVQAATDVFVGVDDEAAYEAMRALAGVGVVAGESGAAGLAGLLAVAEGGTAEERALVGLRPGACVLVVNTEGATDPVNYTRVVGAEPAMAGR